MSALVSLNPSGDKNSRKHFADTMENLVDFRKYESLLTPQIYSKLLNLHTNGLACLWGVVPGVSDRNVKQWEKLGEGSVAIFSRKNLIYASAVVTYRFNSAKLSEHLWGRDKKGQTWQYMYSMSDLKEQNITYQEFNKANGYKSNNIIRGFRVLNERQSDAFLNKFELRSNKYIEEISDIEFEYVLENLDGELDRKATSWHRKEQAKARKRLLGGKATGECYLCGQQLSSEFLIAAHIKRRSECTDAEKRDLDGVMMLACKFGCDYLFEVGYLAIKDFKIEVSNNLKEPVALNYVEKLVGRKVSTKAAQTKYFEWHFENRFRSEN